VKDCGRNRLREYKNKLLRRIFGPNTDQVKGEWKKKKI
jgi:hypothetical protein